MPIELVEVFTNPSTDQDVDDRFSISYLSIMRKGQPEEINETIGATLVSDTLEGLLDQVARLLHVDVTQVEFGGEDSADYEYNL